MTVEELTPFVGKRVRLTARGTTIEGEIRTLSFPRGYAGGNEDGEHTVWFTAMFEHWFRPGEIACVEDVPQVRSSR